MLKLLQIVCYYTYWSRSFVSVVDIFFLDWARYTNLYLRRSYSFASAGAGAGAGSTAHMHRRRQRRRRRWWWCWCWCTGINSSARTRAYREAAANRWCINTSRGTLGRVSPTGTAIMKEDLDFFFNPSRTAFLHVLFQVLFAAFLATLKWTSYKPHRTLIHLMFSRMKEQNHLAAALVAGYVSESTRMSLVILLLLDRQSP